MRIPRAHRFIADPLNGQRVGCQADRSLQISLVRSLTEALGMQVLYNLGSFANGHRQLQHDRQKKKLRH